VPVQRNRLLLLAAAAAAAIVVVVVVIVVAGTGGGSGSSATTTDSTSTTSTGGGSASIFAGVPQHGTTLGNPAAPVTLSVFEDPQCPFCRQWNIDTLQTVVDNYVRPGKLKIVYRGIPIIGTNSIVGLLAIYAAGEQNKLWDMVEALYRIQGQENSGWITPSAIRDAAGAAGANATKILARYKSKAMVAQLNAAEHEATAMKINATPTFVIQKPLGTPTELQVTSLEPTQFTPELDAALQ
jgi:protein-disulfide isomerase